MSIDLPPLHTLPTFEAAARHLSFTIASEELHVTQSAVSQQIRNLEQYLGVKLFQRKTRELVLTDEGRVLAEAARKMIETVSSAAMQIQNDAPSGILTISCLPSFATKWLVPRLGRFRAAFPKIEIVLLSSNRNVDFRQRNVDLAIRWASRIRSDLHCDKLLDELVFPVCSPRFREENEIRSITDLYRVTLLRDADPLHDSWREWLTASDLDPETISSGLHFENSLDMIEASMLGEGVALVGNHLVTEDLRAGRLVRLFETGLPSPFSYYLVCPRAHLDLPKVRAFRNWMREMTRGA